ncbi:MAG TPA: hypothetical protein VM582_00835, partial [Candidatus Thermoplasmatota archaeon]|nr:hypothetical protein [Candidatus Thermoplasmatota archaeon]
MAKPKRRKATLHSAGKVTEQDLLENARALHEDPSLAVPICEGPCVWFSPVKAAQRAIPRVHAARDDEKALARYANRGNELARAYAATLLVAKAEKITIVADLRLPGEKVPYVTRGKAKAFFLAGLQHHDDRARRLLSVAPWARKRGLHFYSAERGIVCTGGRPAPPADFIEEEAALVGLRKERGVYTCGHEGDDLVSLRWIGSDAVFERCESCAGAEGSLLADVRRHVAVPRVERQIAFEARLRPLQGAEGDVQAPLPDALRKAYYAGKLTDRKLLEAARKERVGALRAGAPRFVAGDTSYPDAESFLRALDPTPADERALRAALAAHGGSVVLDRPTLARAVAELWPTQGMRMLEAVSDEEIAHRLHKERPQPDEAVELVRRAAREGSGRAALAALPSYGALPPAASAADAIARAFRGQGREAAVRVAQERANIAKAKGVALA